MFEFGLDVLLPYLRSVFPGCNRGATMNILHVVVFIYERILSSTGRLSHRYVPSVELASALT